MARDLEAELRRRAEEERKQTARSMRPSWEPPHWMVAVAKWAAAPTLAILVGIGLLLHAWAKEVEERAKAIADERQAAAEDRRVKAGRLDELEKRMGECEELKPKLRKHSDRLRPLEAWYAAYTRANPHRAPLPLVVESDEED